MCDTADGQISTVEFGIESIYFVGISYRIKF